MQYRVGSWLVRPDMNAVFGRGEARQIGPKSMDVLTCLTAHPGQVVSKQTLLEEVWGGTIVSDDSLTRCIAELRRAFDDDAREPAVIRTIPKRGYLLLPPVTREEAEAPPAAARRRGWRRWAAAPATLAALLLALGLLAWRAYPSGAHSGNRRIAVLPLADLTGGPAQGYLADDMTNLLAAELARYGSLEVVSGASVAPYHGTSKAAREIAQELGADALLSGSILRSGSRLRLSSQLVNGASGLPVWSGVFERELGAAASTEGEVARAVAGELRLTLGPDARARVDGAGGAGPEAYEAYLHGLYFFDRTRYEAAAPYFRRAASGRPGFPLAQALLAESEFMLAYNADRLPDGPCLEDIEKARKMDDSLAEVRCLLGDRLFMQYDWEGGAAEYRKAVESDPGSVDAAAHHVVCLHALGRWQEAEQAARRALRLDPVSARLNFELLRLFIDAGRFEQALGQFQRMVELDPHNPLPYACMATLYEAQGRPEEALEAQLEADARWSGLDTLPAAALEEARRDGLREHARKSFEQLRLHGHPLGVSPAHRAHVMLQLGEQEEALRSLEEAYRARSPQMIWLKSAICWAPLRSHPRFQALLARMRFPA